MKSKSKTLQWIIAGALGTLLFVSSASAGDRLGWIWGGWGDRGLSAHDAEFDLDGDGALDIDEQAAADAAAAEARAAAEAAREAARAAWEEALAARVAAWEEALAARIAAWEEALAARQAAWEEARAAREEARAALLAAIDTDGDGEITGEEYGAYKAAQAQARFDEADSDASGFIEIGELAAVTGLDIEGDRLASVFAHLAGDDGLIAPDEFSVRRGFRLRWHFHQKGDGEPADKPADGGEKDGGGDDDGGAVDPGA